MRALALAVCIGAASLSGCSSDRLVGREDLRIVPGSELPPPGRADLLLQQRSYLIGPFDKVSIEVYGVPELTRTVQLSSSGTFAMPLVGEIDATGMTTAQLSETIANRLNNYVRDPQVLVNADTVNQMITVNGQVNKPGLFPVQGRMTLIRAIAQAEGTSEFANSHYVVVFRRVDDQDMAALYDLRAIRQGMYADPEVFANDIVYVGESGRARVFSNLLAGSALLSAPLLAVLQ